MTTNHNRKGHDHATTPRPTDVFPLLLDDGSDDAMSGPDFNGWSVTLAGVDLYGVISAIEAISYEDDEELADTLISIRAYLLEAEEAISDAMQIIHRALRARVSAADADD